MGVEGNSLRNKDLYKTELYLLKVMPILLATIYLVNTVLSYYDIVLPALSYIGGLSFIPLLFMYILCKLGKPQRDLLIRKRD